MPDIPVWNKCNNNCLMCANTSGFAANTPRDYALPRQAARLERHLRGLAAYRKNARVAGAWNLTGGEPTLNPDFIKAVAYYRRRLPGAGLTLLSNGRRFADPALAAAFCAAARPPFRLAVSLHGHNAALHDRVAGVKGAFAQTVAGLRNIAAAPRAPELELRVILHRLNYRALGRILSFIGREFPGRRVVVMHYEHEGRGARNAALLDVDLATTSAAVNACARRLAAMNAALYHFPLCLLKPGLRRLAVVSLPPEDRLYPAVCAACRARAACPGLMRQYARLHGRGGLRAL